MERFYFSLAAESILFPLGACLIAYVMWGLLLHVFSFSMKPVPLRIVCGVLGSLPVLGFLLGAAAYWNGWRWCLFAANYYFNLEILRGFYQPLTLILLSVDMLLLALSIETN